MYCSVVETSAAPSFHFRLQISFIKLSNGEFGSKPLSPGFFFFLICVAALSSSASPARVLAVASALEELVWGCLVNRLRAV